MRRRITHPPRAGPPAPEHRAALQARAEVEVAWTVEGPAVEIHADGGTVPLRATSTATVRLPARPGVPARLRMFVDEGMLAGSLPDRGAGGGPGGGRADGWGRLVAENPCGLRERVFTFLDAVRAPLATPWAAPRFGVTRGAPPLTSTCVPARRTGVTWAVQLPGPDGTPDPRQPSRLQDLRLDVIYKDPAVARLPDGSWLLVAARYRVRAHDRPRDYFTVLPGGSLGDIVAWRAEDPAFRGGVTGPYWLVDGRAALPGDPPLAWLGVPGLAVTGSGPDARLDVYYVVEPDEAGGSSYRVALADPRDPPSPDPTGHGQGFDALASRPAGERPLGASTAPPRSPGPPRARGDHVRPGVAVKRFAWDTLSTWLAREAPDEARWDAGEALPGALLGHARVWAATDTPGEVRSLADTFAGTPLRLADPAPLACPTRPDLFVAAIYTTDHADPEGPGGPATPTGHGVWRAAGLPEGAPLCERVGDTCVPLDTREGVDFVVAAERPTSSNTPWRDRLLATTTDAIYGDPDPLRLPGGRAWVAAGDFLLGPGTLGLAEVRGGAGDVCRSWTRAWR